MNGNLTSKKLGMSWECPKQESHKCSLRQCPIKKKEYRRMSHLLRRDQDNLENRKRYHEKYKEDPVFIKKQKDSWVKFVSKQKPGWANERSKKYRKKYSELSPSTRFKIRAACQKWTKENWDRRVEYASNWRRKNITFGFRSSIAEARRSGDIRKLAEECLAAIVRANESGSE